MRRIGKSWGFVLLVTGMFVPLSTNAWSGTRTNNNTREKDTLEVNWADYTRNKQMFMNHFSEMTSINIKIAGPMRTHTNTLTFVIYDGCGNRVKEVVSQFTNQGISTPNTRKWISIPVDTDLIEGEYYIFEVYKNLDFGSKLVLNRNQYVHGRHFESQMFFRTDEKKRDIMFLAYGKGSGPWYPMPKTNVMCPEKCKVIFEDANYDLRFHGFNVVINGEEMTYDESGAYTGSNLGSLWHVVDPATGEVDPDMLDKIERLFTEENDDLVYGDYSVFAEVNPYHEYINEGFRRFNMYVALEDPAVGNGLRGLNYCANIDLNVTLANLPRYLGGSASSGGFSATIDMPLPYTEGWDEWPSAKDKMTLIHELGHAIGGLADEYSAFGKYIATIKEDDISPNQDRIGCPSWCTSYHDVEWLRSVHDANAKRGQECWEIEEKDECRESGSGIVHNCIWMGDVSEVDYWGDYTCIPASVHSYDIGIGCRTDATCSPVAALGSTKMAINLATIDEKYMWSFPDAEVSEPIIEHVREVFDCVFGACHEYSVSRCAAFFDKWANPDNDFGTFYEYGNACEGSRITRR